MELVEQEFGSNDSSLGPHLTGAMMGGVIPRGVGPVLIDHMDLQQRQRTFDIMSAGDTIRRGLLLLSVLQEEVRIKAKYSLVRRI